MSPAGDIAGVTRNP